MRQILLFTLILWSGCSVVWAQAKAGDEDLQQWSEVQLVVPITKKADFLTQVTMWSGKNISRLHEGRFGIGVAFKADKHWAFAGYYQFINARNGAGKFRHEDRFDGRVIYKFPVKNFGLSHRSMLEYRMRSTGSFWNYRPSLTIDKELKFIPHGKLYATEEIFYDSNSGRFSRSRFSVGLIEKFSDRFSLDIYYLRQNDGFAAPGDLNVIGTTCRIHL
jgi:hypothetical protein